MIVLVVALVFVPMLIEARRAARNERAQRAIGGVEPRGDVYPLMQIAYPTAFLAMIAEGAARGAPPASFIAAGLGLYGAAKALKWWAIVSLGQFWTFRVIVVPGARLVHAGPYRFLRHPNYIAVVGELVGVAVMSGARIIGPLATIAFGALMAKRIAVENRAIRGSRAIEATGGSPSGPRGPRD
jgi:methyltransferase